MRDASLDDFFSNSGESEADEGASEREAEAETEIEPDPEAEQNSESEPASDTDSEAEGPPPITEVEPARSTYAWSPDGATCAACGEQVEERWESEVGLVCVECKAW